MQTTKIIELNEENICKICLNQLGKYTCPRCNVLYCTVECYRSEKHLQCSETFYKDCVVNAMSSSNFDPQAKARMEEILKKYKQQDEMDISFENEIDSDDDEDLPDLEDRLKNIDLNDVENVWKQLADHEKQEFVSLIEKGDVTQIVPIWIPWWENKKTKKLVEDMEKPSQSNYKNECPSLLSNIKPLNEIVKTKPAECVKYNLVNVLAAYVSVVRYYNGDHFEFTTEAVWLLTNLSTNLQRNENFENFLAAIESVHQLCLMNDWISISPDQKQNMSKDVKNIVEGPEEQNQTYYVKAALSDMYRLMIVSKKKKSTENRENEFTKRFAENRFKTVPKENLRNYVKKVEFYLSYITSYDNIVN